MPLPMFPQESGVPGDGELVVLWAQPPGGPPPPPPVLMHLGGQIHRLRAVESYTDPNATWPTPSGVFGTARAQTGVTVWVDGSIKIGPLGESTVTDFAEVIAHLDALKATLSLANLEMFVYYRSAAPATYRKYKQCNLVYFRHDWDNPQTIRFVFAVVSADRTLHPGPPGV